MTIGVTVTGIVTACRCDNRPTLQRRIGAPKKARTHLGGIDALLAHAAQRQACLLANPQPIIRKLAWPPPAWEGHMSIVAIVDRRKQVRKQRLWPARITQGSSTWSCVIVEYSVGGAKVRLPNAVRVALAPATISCAQFGEKAGTVVWQTGTDLGIKLH